MGEVLRRMIMVLLAFVAFILLGCVSSDTSGASAPLKVNGVKKASYVSEKGSRLEASFDTTANTVTILLPSGKKITLPRALSGSGARYSNGDETFWEHHGFASYWIGATRIFHGKVEEPK